MVSYIKNITLAITLLTIATNNLMSTDEIFFNFTDKFQSGKGSASVLDPQNIKFAPDKEGVIFGKDHGFKVKIDDWDGQTGAILFQIKKKKGNGEIISPIISFPNISVVIKNGWILMYNTFNKAGGESGQKRLLKAEIPISEQTWTNIGLTWRANDYIHLAINGKIVSSCNIGIHWPTSFSSFNLGGYSPRNESEFIVKNLKMYTRPLYDQEIISLTASKVPVSNRYPMRIPVAVISKPPVIDGEIKPNEYSSKINGLIDTEKQLLYPQHAFFALALDSDFLYIGSSIEIPESHKLTSGDYAKDSKSLISQGDLFCLFIRNGNDLDLGQQRFSGWYITVSPSGGSYDAHETIDWQNGSCLREQNINLDMQFKSKISGGKWNVEMAIPIKKLLLNDKSFLLAGGFSLNKKLFSLTNTLNWFDHPSAFASVAISPWKIINSYQGLFTGNINSNLSVSSQEPSATEIIASSTIGLPHIYRTAKDMVYDKFIGENLNIDISGIIKNQKNTLGLSSQKHEDSFSFNYQLKSPGKYLLINTLTSPSGEIVYYRNLPFEYYPAIDCNVIPFPSDQIFKVNISIYDSKYIDSGSQLFARVLSRENNVLESTEF